jgi:choline dehydrogenase-like flavoprotein
VITDAEGLASGTNLPADVCILGAGAAGITLARALSGNGLQVVVVESGAETLEPDIQDLARGESVGETLGFTDNPATLDSIRLRQLGGTTNHWAGFCRPYDEVDFEVRPQLERSGWPITRADLDPWYQATHEVLGLGPYRFDWEYWVDELGGGEPLIDTPLVQTGVYQIHDLRFGPAYRDELQAADDVNVLLRANAVDLRLDGDVVNEVRVKTLGGVELTVTGMRVVVEALGGIENARLLLACNSQRPAGIGNEADLVGRHFCEHFAVPAAIAVSGSDPAALSALFEADLGAEAGSLRVKGNVALTSEAVRERGLLSLDCQVVVGPYARERPRVISGLGISEIAAVAQSTGTQPPKSSLYLLATAEQELNPESRVRLGRETDPLGLPRVELDWQFTERDRSSIIDGMTLMGDELARTGVGRLQVTPGTITFESTDGIRPYVGGLAIDADAADPTGFELGLGFHHMCTTRMAADPAEGVVDADLRVHTVDNLYVAGSSSFGTAGASTPTYTLVALTLRLADHLLAEVLA